MRAFAEKIYDIPPEQVIGSRGKLKFEMRDGEPVIVKLPDVQFIDDKAGKRVGIQMDIGRRPIAAFGNSDGDLQMLEWIQPGSGARLMMLVHHDDAVREFALGHRVEDRHIQRTLMAEAKKNGWTVISIKGD